jgi:hypothetical protein
MDQVCRTMPDQQIKRLPDVNRDKRFVGILLLGDLGGLQGAGPSARPLRASCSRAASTLRQAGCGPESLTCHNL